MAGSWNDTKVSPLAAVSIIIFAIALLVSFGIYIYKSPSSSANVTDAVQQDGISSTHSAPVSATDSNHPADTTQN